MLLVRTLVLALLLLAAAVATCSGMPIIVHREMISRALSGNHALASPLANMTVEFRESLFAKINAVLLPIINKAVEDVKVPGESEKHYSFDTFNLEGKLGALSLDFAPPNQLILTMNNFDMDVPSTGFCVMDKILFVHLKCCGSMDASVSNTNIVVKLDISNDAGVLKVTTGETSVSFGSVSVNHHFPGFFCKIGNDIIQLFIGDINKLIEDAVKDKVPAVVGPAITDGFNDIFGKLPFLFLSQPVVKTDSVEVVVEINWKTGSQGQNQHLLPTTTTKRGKTGPLPVLTDHDINMYVTDVALDVIFREWTVLGVLDGKVRTPPGINTTLLKAYIPAAYNACPGCPFESTFTPVQPPHISFVGDSIHLDIKNAKSDLNAVNSAGAAIPLVSLLLNATVEMNSFTVTGATGNTIMFTLAIPTLAFNVAQSSIGPVSGQFLNAIVSTIVNDVFLPGFNKAFKGLTFPTIDGAGIGSLELEIGDHNFAVGADVTLPS